MILIIGGAGYIGSHTNKILNQKGYETVVYDNLVHGHRNFVKWGHFILGDLADHHQLSLCFKKFPIDAVMHFGAFCYLEESVRNPANYYSNNVSNAITLLNTMLEYGVRYFIFSSTCATYGNPIFTPIHEEHPQKPINPYGRTKLMIEEILKDYSYAYDFKHINLRYFNAAGADPKGQIGEYHEPEPHLIPRILDVALGKTERISIYGTDYDTFDGTCVRDYIHVNDIAEAHILALEYLKCTNTSNAFNLSNDNGFSVRDVINAVEKVTNIHIETTIAERRPGDPPILIGDSQKARKILGWQPLFNDIHTIIETAWIWHKSIFNISSAQ